MSFWEGLLNFVADGYHDNYISQSLSNITSLHVQYMYVFGLRISIKTCGAGMLVRHHQPTPAPPPTVSITNVLNHTQLDCRQQK